MLFIPKAPFGVARVRKSSLIILLLGSKITHLAISTNNKFHCIIVKITEIKDI